MTSLMEQQINHISSILVLNIFARDIFTSFSQTENDKRKIIPQETNVREKIMSEKKSCQRKKTMSEEKCQRYISEVSLEPFGNLRK